MNVAPKSKSEAPKWVDNTINLASPRLKTRAVRCTDDSFASMDRMLRDSLPVWKEDVYDDYGKWMDGWESKRRRDGGHDWCVVKLGARGTIRGVDIDTSYFTGNYPPAASILASDATEDPGDDSAAWTEIVPATGLGPDAHHYVEVDQPGPWRWIRLNYYPDGGIARLKIFGQTDPDWSETGNDIVELSSLNNGGRVIAWNNAHYGDVWAVLSEDRGKDMGDGWETRRRREPGSDWLIIALGKPGVIDHIVVDTGHYKGNFPDGCSVQGALVEWGSEDSLVTQSMFWPTVLDRKKLSADNIHTFDNTDLLTQNPVSHIRLNIHPDGGISRFRVFGCAN